MLSNGPTLVSEYFFIIPVYVGYFVIGNYLVNVQVQRRALVALTILGVALTAIGTSVLAVYLNGSAIYFYQEYLSPTIIIASLALFVLIISYKPKDKSQTEKPSWKQHIIHTISKNTLGIYFLHMIIIYSLQNYVFSGSSLTGNAVNSIISIPLITVLTLGLCSIIIWSLKKIPVMSKLIG
jgi:surface polysaccharide O-acyltransferase-like enzyme